MLSFVFFLIGLSIGSFLNVLIDRIPQGEDVVFGRSRCDYCGKTLRWFELVPVLSFIVQFGRCRRCHARLSVQYPFVECLTGILFAWVYVSVGVSYLGEPGGWYHFVAALAVVAASIVITVTDFKYQIIPDMMLVFLLLFGLITQIPLSQHAMVTHMVTGIGVWTLFYLLWAGTRGRGMGFGDVKLSFVLGLMLGFPSAVVALYAAFLTGAFYGVILMIQGKAKMKSRVAFGPFLLFGAVIAFIWSNQILHWWGFI